MEFMFKSLCDGDNLSLKLYDSKTEGIHTDNQPTNISQIYSITLATNLVTGVTVGCGGVTVAGLAATRQEGFPVAI